MKKILLSLCCLSLYACENVSDRVQMPQNSRSEDVAAVGSVQNPQHQNDNAARQNSLQARANASEQAQAQVPASIVADESEEKTEAESAISAQNPVQNAEFRETIVPLNKYDAAALKVAGKYAEKAFLDDPAYKKYVKNIEKGWNKLSKESLSKIPSWVQQYVNPKIENVEVVFYPFGGPDAAYVLEFFPNASKYIIVGLEKMGSFEKVSKSLGDISIVSKLQKAMNSFLERGYFITSEMLGDFADNNSLSGALLTVLLQLSKLNCRILDIKNISIDCNGQEVAYNKSFIECTKIKFVTKTNAEKEIYYVRLDLHDYNPCCKWLMAFVDKFDFCTFIKSASYKFHDYTLADMRSFVINRSQFILQDDTGVPLMFLGNKWKKYPFGKYKNTTLARFQCYKQNNLEELYAKSSPVEIPFKIGYGYNLATPNLLLSVPKMKRSKSSKIIVEEVNAVKDALKNEKSSCVACSENSDNNIVVE